MKDPCLTDHLHNICMGTDLTANSLPPGLSPSHSSVNIMPSESTTWSPATYNFLDQFAEPSQSIDMGQYHQIENFTDALTPRDREAYKVWVRMQRTTLDYEYMNAF